MDKIRVCFKAVGEVNIFCGREIESRLTNLVLKVMLNNGFTEFYLYQGGELDRLAESVLLHGSEIIKQAVRKRVIKVLSKDCGLSAPYNEKDFDGIIRIDKDYDDWLLENCDLLVADDSKEFYESGLLKKAEALNKRIICLRCDNCF